MKRILALILTLLTVVTAFAACTQSPAATGGSHAQGDGGNSDKPDADSPAKPNQPIVNEDGQKVDQWGRPWVDSALPEDLKFNEEVVTIYIDATSPGDWYTEGYNDELINDSVYERNLRVESELNVKLNFMVSSASLANRNFVSEIDTIVSAGTNDYHIVSGYGYFLTSGVKSSLFANLYNIPYLDLDKPWWNQSYIQEATLAGQLYTLTGDVSLSTTYNAGCLFFNKRLANEEYADLGGADYIYNLVLDGRWTIDQFTELVKDKYRDLDGDGVPSDGDFYGFGTIMSGPIPADSFQFGMDALITRDNGSGIPEFVFDSQKTVDALHKLYVLTQDCDGVMFDVKNYNSFDARMTIRNKFISGSMIFHPGYLEIASEFVNMKDDYGLLPMPKFDEKQAEYKTSQCDDYYAIAIPWGIDEDEALAKQAGAVLEKICEESYRTVTPNYFEVAMKYRYLRSEDDSDYDLQMYDIILEGNDFNFGLIFSSALGDPSFAYRHLIGKDGSENFASYWGQKSTLTSNEFKRLVNWFMDE